MSVVPGIECRHRFAARGLDVLKAVSLLLVDTGVRRSHVDAPFLVFAQAVEVVARGQVVGGSLSVEAHQTVAVGGHAQPALAVLQHRVHRVQGREHAAYLSCRLRVLEAHHAQSAGAGYQVAVAPLQQAGGIAIAGLALQVEHRHIVKPASVPRLQGAIHAKVEAARGVLHHAVHVVAGQRAVGIVLVVEFSELVAVIAVDAVASGNPQESLTVDIYLRDEAARQLVVIEEFARLCVCCDMAQ